MKLLTEKQKLRQNVRATLLSHHCSMPGIGAACNRLRGGISVISLHHAHLAEQLTLFLVH
jgi:hypothetical protein